MAERGIDREHCAPGLANVRDAIPFPRTPETRGIDPRYFSRELVNGRR
jgi:hypothetical protein